MSALLSAYACFYRDIRPTWSPTRIFKKRWHLTFLFISYRFKSAATENKASPVQSKGPVTTLDEPSDHLSKDKTSGCYVLFLKFSRLVPILVIKLEERSSSLFIHFIVSFLWWRHRWATPHYHGIHLCSSWFHPWIWANRTVLWKWAFAEEGSKVCTFKWRMNLLLFMIFNYTSLWLQLSAFLTQEADYCNWWWQFNEDAAARQHCAFWAQL